MASEHAHDMLRVIEDMVHERREEIVKRENLKQQMKAREGWDDILFDEVETELVRSGAVKISLDEEYLQVLHYEL